jgi:hypothetical protein
MNVLQVHRILGRFRKQLARIYMHRMKRFRRVHQVHCLWQGLEGEDLHAIDNSGFAGVGFRHRDRLQSGLTRRQGSR